MDAALASRSSGHRLLLTAGINEAERMDVYYLNARTDAYRVDDKRLRLLVDLCQGPRILDIGCGTGDLLLELHEHQPEWQLAGTEISRVALGVCIGRNVPTKLYLDNGVLAGPWNTIVMGQVLEHLHNDRAMVDAAGAELAPGGRLVVSVPNKGKVFSPDHKREYTAKTLRELLRRVGRVRHIHWIGEETRLIMYAQKTREGG